MANLCELFDNIVQMQALNGVPLANGKLYVYALGRTRLMDTWSDVDGESLNTNPIILDDAGQAHVYVSDDFDYTLVVCDAYNNEVFSIDKYLYSKGEHSHADVAVAPSEHIAVSSYHVGETTVYVPYIVGELGKTYHGIEPIVVNNQENKISARNIALGVQEPLYFVEDSESACIIGASGLQPSGNYATVEWVTEHNFMSEDNVQFDENGNITAYNGSAFAGGYVDPSDFIPWSASGNFATSGDLNDKLDTTAFSNVSGDFLTAVPDDYATKDFVSSGLSSKLDSTAFSTVSGNFLTAHQSLDGYATEQWVSSQGYITAHQSLDGLMSASLLESSGGLITGYNGTAFAGQGGGVTGEYELSAGNGISINNDPIEQKTVISVSADYATNSDLQTVSGDITAMIPSTAGLATTGDVNALAQSISENYQPIGDYLTADALDNVSGNWNEVSAKLDTTAFSDVSGTFLTAHQDLSNYATTASVAEKLDTTAFSDVSSTFLTSVDLTPYQLTADMTAYQPVGSYLTADALDNVSGGWNEVSAKLDTTAFSDVSGTFLTAHQDISNKLDTTAFSDVSSTFLTAVPDTYLQNTDLSTADGKVTAISGIPLSAGGDVPEGVMVESGLEYNAVNEISGYNGSAIAQYGAEKQWLVHDDTLVHLSNSAQYALGVNLSAVAQLLGVDETVLWSGTLTAINSTATLSEPVSSFEKIGVWTEVDGQTQEHTISAKDGYATIGYQWTWYPTLNNYNFRNCFLCLKLSGDKIITDKAITQTIAQNGGITVLLNEEWTYRPMRKIVGIGRKEV